MPFSGPVAAHVFDSKLFAEPGAGWAGERMRSLGANSVTANQVVMGGEMAGQVWLRLRLTPQMPQWR